MPVSIIGGPGGGGGGGDVPSTRTISTTAPLSGGGDLSANRTLSISNATTSAAGAMSAVDKLKLDGIEEGADVTDATNVAAAGAVMTSRTITATAPLRIDGGGSADLSTNRTLSIADATTSAAGAMSAVDKLKLDGIEEGADVTDATNVAAAGAVMDSDFGSELGRLTRTGDGAYAVIKDNLSASGAPTASSDSGAGYSVGSLWVWPGNGAWICVDATSSSAQWERVQTTDLQAAYDGGVTIEVDGAPVTIEGEAAEALLARDSDTDGSLELSGKGLTKTDASGGSGPASVLSIYGAARDGGELAAGAVWVVGGGNAIGPGGGVDVAGGPGATGGDVGVYGGDGESGGGDVSIYGGLGPAAGGDVQIEGGPSDALGGKVSIQGGAGDDEPGAIEIGTERAKEIKSGREDYSVTWTHRGPIFGGVHALVLELEDTTHEIESWQANVVYTYAGSGAATVTVPAGLRPGLVVGFVQLGDDPIVFEAGSGVTLVHSADFSPATASKGAPVFVEILSDTHALVMGDMAAAP